LDKTIPAARGAAQNQGMTKTVTFLLAGLAAGGMLEPVALRALGNGLTSVAHTVLIATSLDTLQPGTWYIIGGLIVMALAVRASTR
jgi:hypothetical protein